MQEIKQMGDYCPECSALAAKGVWEDGTHRYRHNGKHELTIECRPLPHSPAAPPEDAKALEDAKAFKRVAIELRIRFPVEIQYNSEFEAMVKRLEGGSL